MTTKTCATCAFCDQTDTMHLLCRHGAPPAAVMSVAAPDHGFEAWWPQVLSTDWCAQWQQGPQSSEASE